MNRTVRDYCSLTALHCTALHCIKRSKKNKLCRVKSCAHLTDFMDTRRSTFTSRASQLRIKSTSLGSPSFSEFAVESGGWMNGE